MNLHTQVKLPKKSFILTPSSKAIFLGSCFAENIGQKMCASMDDDSVIINPFGVLYNPGSILIALKTILYGSLFFPDNFIFKDEQNIYHSWMHSTAYSSDKYSECREKIMADYHKATKLLKDTNVLCITLGTNHVYIHRKNGEIVSNCHKQSAKLFNETTLSVQQIVQSYQEVIKDLHAVVPELQIVLTVSPYRYAKYGLHNNQISKSILLLACEQLSQEYKYVHYFPAYEILNDELRDYRFYADDMLHPSSVAIDYIWERWKEWCFEPKHMTALNINAKKRKRNQHKPLIK